MPTHAEIADKLLMEAAAFFKMMGQQEKSLEKQLYENAAVFEQMAGVLIKNPNGATGGSPHGELAGRLLGDAANFFRGVGKQNPPIAEQMDLNAEIYEHIGKLVSSDPLGMME